MALSDYTCNACFVLGVFITQLCGRVLIYTTNPWCKHFTCTSIWQSCRFLIDWVVNFFWKSTIAEFNANRETLSGMALSDYTCNACFVLGVFITQLCGRVLIYTTNPWCKHFTCTSIWQSCRFLIDWVVNFFWKSTIAEFRYIQVFVHITVKSVW